MWKRFFSPHIKDVGIKQWNISSHLFVWPNRQWREDKILSRMWVTDILIHPWKGWKMVMPLWKAVSHSNVNIPLSYKPPIVLLGIWLNKTCIYKILCVDIFIHYIFLFYMNRLYSYLPKLESNQLLFSIGEWISKIVIHADKGILVSPEKKWAIKIHKDCTLLGESRKPRKLSII